MEKKVIMVKGVEVEVVGDILRFEKDGELVEVKREIGKSDYSVVYLELVRKGERRVNDGWKKVGNFEYKLNEEENEATIRRYNSEEIVFENVAISESELKYIRTSIINILINNL